MGRAKTSDMWQVTSDKREIEEGTQILSKKFVELVVGADPCPLDSIAATFTDHANIPAYSRRPIIGVSAETTAN